jgi:hypothetical protein
MVHYFTMITMVEENGTGNAYKKMKNFETLFNADTLIFNYWEIQQIKFTLKKVTFSVTYP